MASRRLVFVLTPVVGVIAGITVGAMTLSVVSARHVVPSVGTVTLPAPITRVFFEPPAEPTVASSTDRASEVSLLFLGDIMLNRAVEDRIRVSKQPTYPFERIRQIDGSYFRGQDLVIANLEGPVTALYRPPEKEIDFAFHPSVVATLKTVGINAVSQANNHTLDQGRAGATDSRSALTDAGITVFGDQVKDDEGSALAIVSARSVNIALLGFNTTDGPLDRVVAGQAIDSAKQQADRVVVYMHWGEEYRARPNAAQIELAHWLIEKGVDAVIGAHPHWMQSVELYRGKPIAYSLGNFIFDQDWSKETTHGLAVKLKFGALASELQLHPVSIVKSQPAFLTGTERNARLERLVEISDPSLSEQILKGVITF